MTSVGIRPCRLATGGKVGRQAGNDRRSGGEQLGRLAHEPKRHHAAVGRPADVDPPRIGDAALHKLCDQRANERDIVAGLAAPHTPGGRAAVVPGTRNRVGIDGNQSFAVDQRLEARASLRILRIERTAVQHDGGRVRSR
jgi:hypothetical protein